MMRSVRRERAAAAPVSTPVPAPDPPADTDSATDAIWPMNDYPPTPEVLALIVCDQIITDRVTGKQSLISMFSTIHSWRFPIVHPQLCVHVALTEGRGRTPLIIRIVDSDDARPPVVEGKGMVEFKNPRAIANLALQFHGLVFPEPGEYRVQLLCHDTLLREAKLQMVRVKRPPKASTPPSAN